jgi:glycosyltransferase involved in cell wall biosynthesis
MSIGKTLRLSPARALREPRVVITMPAYNAEATLARTVADIPAGIADKLILVDDASPDNTAALARELGIDVHVHSRNRGYGGNQKTCYALALRDDADIVVMLHPDYQYEPKAVPLLVSPIVAGDADMTFGSRFAGLGDPLGGGMPLARFVGNRVTTLLENVMLGSRFSEMHSGMRAYTRECLLSLPFLRYGDGFIFDSQLLIDAVTSGQRVVEVPIPTRYTEESSSIGILRSVSYVAGSVGYCGLRVWGHGRRRHRSPVGRRIDRGVRHGLRAESGATTRLASSLAAVEGYFVPGRRLVVLGGSAGPHNSWELTELPEPEVGEEVDAVVVLEEEALDAVGGLRTLRQSMSRTGVLALPASRSHRDAMALEARLLASGLRLVEWSASRGAGVRLPLAIARPIESGGEPAS